MLLRIFTRRTARQVDPADVLERPRPMRIDEVHKTLTGLRLLGYPTTGQDARRVSVELKPDDPVEAPVSDRDTVVDVFRHAFAALAKQHEDDDIAPELRFEWGWNMDESAFTFKTPMGWVIMGFVAEPAAPPPPKPAAKAAAPARKAAKATKTPAPADEPGPAT